jgi:serine/threonine protein kinase
MYLTVMQDKPYNEKSDVWSAGCVLYELASLQRPFSGNSVPGSLSLPLPHLLFFRLMSFPTCMHSNRGQDTSGRLPAPARLLQQRAAPAGGAAAEKEAKPTTKHL